MKHLVLIAIALLERLAHRLWPTYKPRVRWVWRSGTIRNSIFIDKVEA